MWTALTISLLLHWIQVLSAQDVEGVPNNDIGPNKFGTHLVTELRNDANLDLSQDEEYEDLRAELLAYHTAFAKLTDFGSRRSMMSTPCWQLRGICVNFKLCSGFRFLTEVPGCRDHHNVCCFTWNRYHVKDMRDHGMGGPYPWSVQTPYGGAGIEDAERSEEVTENTKLKKKKKKNSKTEDNKNLKDDEILTEIDKNNLALRNKKHKKKHKLVPIKRNIPSHSRNLHENDERFDRESKPLVSKRKRNVLKNGLSKTETLALIVRDV